MSEHKHETYGEQSAATSGYVYARNGADYVDAWDEFLDLCLEAPSWQEELAFRDGWKEGRQEYEHAQNGLGAI